MPEALNMIPSLTLLKYTLVGLPRTQETSLKTTLKVRSRAVADVSISVLPTFHIEAVSCGDIGADMVDRGGVVVSQFIDLAIPCLVVFAGSWTCRRGYCSHCSCLRATGAANSEMFFSRFPGARTMITLNVSHAESPRYYLLLILFPF